MISSWPRDLIFDELWLKSRRVLREALESRRMWPGDEDYRRGRRRQELRGQPLRNQLLQPALGPADYGTLLSPRVSDRTPVTRHRTMYACSREPSAASSSAPACVKVSDREGRPSRPRRVSTSAETLRRTRSCPSACRTARVRQLCAFCSVRVTCVAAIFFSAVRTSCTVRSRSGIVPMIASSGRSESRLTSTVLAERPGRPSSSQSATAFFDRIGRSGPDTGVQFRVQRLELVLDLGLGLAADLAADPLPVHVETERDHPAPAPRTRLVMVTIPAVALEQGPDLQELGGAEGI
jgi:hypothetical protein